MAEEPKPAYVTFEVRSIEDREATIAAGHYVGNDVTFALITPAGTRERVEKNADEWIAQLKRDVADDRIPLSWLEHYERKYKAFKEGLEDVESGTSVADWPAASPSQVKMLFDMGVRTIEQVAEMTEEAITRVGMGGRALKQRAVAYLEAANDTGKLAEEVNKLRVENESLRKKDEERDAAMAELQKQVKALSKENA